MTHEAETDVSAPEEAIDDLSLQLFERLNQGDSEAVEKAFFAYEPELRVVVRRHLPQRLRTKFDSVDVVQSVWTSVLQGLREGNLQFKDDAHLRAFLIRLALLRFIDLCRQYRNALGRERPLATLKAVPPRGATRDRPHEIVQADELLDRLMMLCSPSHRELLRLKAMGLRVAEIAARTGFHEGSIRRIFCDLARRLDAQEGGTPGGPGTEGVSRIFQEGIEPPSSLDALLTGGERPRPPTLPPPSPTEGTGPR